MIRSIYRRILPQRIRVAVYWLLRPEYRWQRYFFHVTRKAVRDYIEKAARERWLHGIVLEIGSGTDRISYEVFQRHCPDVTFLRSELSPGGYGRNGEAAAGAYDLYCDVTRLAIGDQSLDGIVCSEVLEHVADYQAALNEIARVLKPKGKLLITSPFLYPLHGPVDYWRFTPLALEKLLQEDFVIKDISLAPVSRKVSTFPVNIGILAERRGVSDRAS